MRWSRTSDKQVEGVIPGSHRRPDVALRRPAAAVAQIFISIWDPPAAAGAVWWKIFRVFARDRPGGRAHNLPMLDPDLNELDMIGRELYARRMQQLTLFGAMSQEQAHTWAMRYALGQSAIPLPDDYPDDYAAPQR